jgi:hypothetical protein
MVASYFRWRNWLKYLAGKNLSFSVFCRKMTKLVMLTLFDNRNKFNWTRQEQPFYLRWCELFITNFYTSKGGNLSAMERSWSLLDSGNSSGVKKYAYIYLNKILIIWYQSDAKGCVWFFWCANPLHTAGIIYHYPLHFRMIVMGNVGGQLKLKYVIYMSFLSLSNIRT